MQQPKYGVNGAKTPLLENVNQRSIDTIDNDSLGKQGSDQNNDYKFDVSDIYKLNPEDLK